MTDFISEDDLNTFEGYLRYQGINPATTAPDVLAQFREVFEQAAVKRLATPPVGAIFKPAPNEHRYAVALREGSNLWLAFVVKRNRSGVFAFWIRSGFLPHASYHSDGTFHFKTDEQQRPNPSPKRQPLTSEFKGHAHMGTLAGHGPKAIGAICNPDWFSDVIEVPPGILGPRDGFVAVDLVEPGCAPHELVGEVTHERTFKDSVPWIVVRVGKQRPL